MSRSREFDPDAALQRAMELFWEQGYEATPIAQLTERLGIGRASLYAAFGDKRQLYLKAIQRYLDTREPNPLELLSQPGPALPKVQALVDAYVNESATDQQHRGCLVVNAATECGRSDESVARLVESSWGELETALASALLRARAQGEIPSGSDPRALARFLLVFLQGIRVIAKTTPDLARMRDAADHALRSLLEE